MSKPEFSHEAFKSSVESGIVQRTLLNQEGSNGDCGPSKFVSDPSCLPCEFTQKGYLQENKQAQEEASLEVIQWMSLKDLSKERIDFWQLQKGDVVHRGVQGSLMDGLVCGKLREIGEDCPSQIREVCRTDFECRDGGGAEREEEEVTRGDDPTGQDDGHKVKGSSQSCNQQGRRDSVMDTGGSSGVGAKMESQSIKSPTRVTNLTWTLNF